jgi:hypothetical protein
MPLAVMGYLCAAAAQPTWPPDSGFCTTCRDSLIINNPLFASNQQVRVTHDGGSGSISFSQFLNQVPTADDRTYLIAASDTPYVVGCRSVYIGSYGTNAKRSRIVIRGETGRREDVVLVGEDPAVDPDYWKSSQYGGPSPCGAGQFLQLYYCEHVVVADLTMRNFPGHMLKLDGGYSGGQAWYPRDVVFHNLQLHDCGDQMIKGASGADENPIGCADGILQCSYLHYTDGLNIESSYETQGIDLHEGHNWVVRDNVFEQIRIQKTAAHASNGAGVIMWDRTDSILVERNLFINCDAAIKLGASWYDDGSDWMWARNNVVIYDDPDSRYEVSNMFEIGRDVTNGYLHHNTIWNPAQPDNGTMFYCPNATFPFENNVFYHGSTHRAAGARDNVKIADSTWFVSAGAMDFRPAQQVTMPAAGVTEDVTRRTRGNPPTAGAYEWSSNPVRRSSGAPPAAHPRATARELRMYDMRGRVSPGVIGSCRGLRMVPVADGTYETRLAPDKPE